VTSMK